MTWISVVAALVRMTAAAYQVAGCMLAEVKRVVQTEMCR
jgi:hypothetical protein